MSGLNEYLKAKLVRNTVPDSKQAPVLKSTPPKILEKHRHRPKYDTESDSDLNPEDDYSAGSSFWKTYVQKNDCAKDNSRTTSPTKIIAKSTPNLDDCEFIHASNTSSVAKLLRKIKDEKEIAPSIIDKLSTETISESPDISTSKIENDKLQDYLATLISSIKASSLIVENIKSCSASAEVLSQLKSLNERISNLDSPNERLNSIEKKLDFLLDKLSSYPHEIHNPTQFAPSEIDRPTKNIIVGINDKIIQMSKYQEHNFENCLKKLTALEKFEFQKQKLADISKIENRLQEIQLQNTDIFKFLKGFGQNQQSSSSLGIEDDDRLEKLEQEFKRLRMTIGNDSKITQDRMAQFLDMFSIIEQVYSKDRNMEKNTDLKTGFGELKDRNDLLANLESKVEKDIKDLMKQNEMLMKVTNNINTLVVSYLPLNLESKLYRIEELLRH